MADMPSINQILKSLSIEQSLNELPKPQSEDYEMCEKCGMEKKNYVTEYNGYSIIYRCDCEFREKKREIEEQINEAKRRHIESLFAKSNLGLRFRNCTIENFILRPGTEESFTVAKKYIAELSEKKKTGMGIVFFGKCGNGKTHLAAAIINEAVQKGYTAIFQPVSELMDRLNKTYSNRDESEHDIKEGLSDADLLVLDDLGDNKKTEAIETRIKTIIDKRYRFKLPTIITTNLDLYGLEKYVGEKTYSRICETCVFVHNTGSDYRKEMVLKNGKH